MTTSVWLWGHLSHRTKLMKKSSYQQLAAEVVLKNGLNTQYALGLTVNNEAGHRAWSHGGDIGLHF